MNKYYLAYGSNLSMAQMAQSRDVPMQYMWGPQNLRIISFFSKEASQEVI
jgi:hypothetical protein